ncbi:hypothetical protein F4827_003643 [Paraburkholderia bannensis]|uniref:Uncharacterized protein n=1 Tax=Paraburkholderia bannensis TaxID=765414 RepID=A0A7W9TYK2_9BURK|nr:MULTISPECIES: hypothetical protein [Paraburkholderia]MBB3258774.1 hypothetical protein [Paraburkholderia sp. WP4_3_2]MBB6103788.1 hypothetical protein [Paraburkholderia bannensis]
MSLPEWGYSYNALRVPLTSDWQCSRVPARDVGEPTSWWSLSYDERQQRRKDREKQIEHDRRDFDRLFRVSTSRRAARACGDFSACTAFIREYLLISGLSAPVDGNGVTRILRDAVRDGSIIPAIDRAWRGSRRVSRFYAPQSWPKRAPDPKPTVYGVRDAQFIRSTLMAALSTTRHTSRSKIGLLLLRLLRLAAPPGLAAGLIGQARSKQRRLGFWVALPRWVMMQHSTVISRAAWGRIQRRLMMCRHLTISGICRMATSMNSLGCPSTVSRGRGSQVCRGRCRKCASTGRTARR